MNIVDLHPEDLIDKLVRGQLTEPEAARLRVHLESCGVCRFECTARAAFDDLAEEVEDTGKGSRVVGHGLVVESAPCGAGERCQGMPSKPEGRSTGRATLDGVARRPRWIRSQTPALLAAALLTVAGGAIGAIWSHRVFSQDGRLRSSEVPALESTSRSNSPRPRTGQAVLSVSPAASVCPLPPSVESQDLVAGQVSSAATLPPALPRDASSGERAHGHRSLPAQAVSEGGPEVTPGALFAGGNNARRNGDAVLALRLYRELQERHPTSREARLSHATVGRLLLDRGDPGSAQREFDRYLSEGGGILEEEALVGSALAFRALGRYSDEADTWSRMLSRYPTSAYARQAKGRLAALGRP